MKIKDNGIAPETFIESLPKAEPRLKWERDMSKYCQSHRHGSCGKIRMFYMEWNRGGYKLTCLLPGIKDILGTFTEEEAKRKAEFALAVWLKISGL